MAPGGVIYAGQELELSVPLRGSAVLSATAVDAENGNAEVELKALAKAAGTHLGKVFGKSLWEKSLWEIFGKNLWEKSLGEIFGGNLWEKSLGGNLWGAIFGGESWEKVFGW